MEMSKEVIASNNDRDALHILPLSILPFQTPALKRARMIKNTRLQSVVELFSDKESGSGQMEIRELGELYGWDETTPHPDLILLRKLSRLPSFDVYSLRILLRENGIDVVGSEALRLSPEKTKDLTEYMSTFTHQLIKEIYGSSDLDINNLDDIISLFRDPNIKDALQKLEIMATKLGIELREIPKFLEDYGDIFLSLSFYRQTLDQLVPTIEQFLASMDDLRSNWQLKQDRNLMKTCLMLETTINGLMVATSGRFENFDRSTKDMWENLSAEKFAKVKELIESYHTTIGGVLCALSVKIDAWAEQFPNSEFGGPVRRAEFIMSTMKQGIESIKEIEDSAPMLSGLND